MKKVSLEELKKEIINNALKNKRVTEEDYYIKELKNKKTIEDLIKYVIGEFDIFFIYDELFPFKYLKDFKEELKKENIYYNENSKVGVVLVNEETIIKDSSIVYILGGSPKIDNCSKVCSFIDGTPTINNCGVVKIQNIFNRDDKKEFVCNCHIVEMFNGKSYINNCSIVNCYQDVGVDTEIENCEIVSTYSYCKPLIKDCKNIITYGNSEPTLTKCENINVLEESEPILAENFNL